MSFLMENINFFAFFLSFLFIEQVIEIYLSFRNRISIKNNRNEVPDDFKETISLKDHQKAAEYQLTLIDFGFFFRIYGLLVLLLWTIGGYLSKLSFYSSTLTNNDYLNGILLLLSIIVINLMLSLPVSLIRTFHIEDKYGFNNTTYKTFILDKLKGLILSSLIGLPIFLAVAYFINIFNNNWWIYSYILFMLFQFFLLWIYPTVIAPLFNKFIKLDDPAYEEKINSLLEKTEFEAKGLFVMDGSTRSNHGNAYFTGFGKNKRIVFYDTLLDTLKPGEVEAVLAHELGHYKLKHIQKSLLVSVVTSLVGFYLLYAVFNVDSFFIGHGLDHLTIYSKIYLFYLVIGVYTFFTTPISSFYSRKREFESDDYSVKFTDGNHMISALIKLIKDNASTLTPDNLYSSYYYSHPPASERINNIKGQL
tara:strand:+ start:145 stop:1404 length:1260 start_codon:yes stop_codon:yes gene_type:complete